MHLCLPQGCLASDDKYTQRYDKVINDTHETQNSRWHFHIWDYLYLCAIAGIIINDQKFKFCIDTVKFAGLKLTPTITLLI